MAITLPLSSLSSRFDVSRFGNDRVVSQLSAFRSPMEFLNIKHMSRPANFGEAQTRASYNLSHYSGNYAAIIAMLSIYSLLTNLGLLFLIVFVVGGLFGIGKLQGQDLNLGFARFNTAQLYIGLAIIAIPVAFWVSPFATILWLIGASAVVIGLHSCLMERPIETSFGGDAV